MTGSMTGRMTGRRLQPLAVGEVYGCPLLCNVEFTSPDLERELQGEATALLRLTFANDTAIEAPVRAYQLQMLMGNLMRAFPQQALVQLRFQGDDGAPDPDALRRNC